MKTNDTPLRDFCKIVQGGKLKFSGKDLKPEGFPAYGAGGINGFVETAEFNCEAIILSSIGARCGKCFHAAGGWTSLANTQIIFPDTDKADIRFLWYQLNDEKKWHRSGTGQPFIKPSDVKERRAFLPPLEEQRRIAAILDKAEYLKTNATKRSSMLEALSRSIFINSFGLPSKNEHQFPMRKLIDICNPKQWPTISSKQLQEEGYPVFGANGLIGYYETFNHPEPTVLVTCRGATCGTVNISPPNCYVTGNSMAMDSPDPEFITTEFLAWALRVRGMHDVISGSAQPQITRQGLEGVTIPVPTIQEQRDFTNKLRAITRLDESSRACEASVLEISKSLLKQLIYS